MAAVHATETGGTAARRREPREKSRTIRRTEILLETCPQCGCAEAVCEVRTERGRSSRFKTCPHCGFAEEDRDGARQSWQGNGVYVLQSPAGMVKAGVFPRPVPDSKVAALKRHFAEMGSVVQLVTRWNERENRLEVLFGQKR